LVVSEPYRGKGIGKQLVEVIIKTARSRGIRQVKVRPVARNASAIRFFHEMGFDVLGHIELFIDLKPEDQQVWRFGEQITGKDFRI
jgi:GNAT superfamily N-acetyltransferase